MRKRNRHFRAFRRLAIGLVLLLLGLHAANSADGERRPLETVKWQPMGHAAQEAEGRVIVEAQDGGLLVQSRDGRFWSVEKPHLLSRTDRGQPFRPLAAAALADQLTAELGNRYQITVTKHYIICSTAPKKYAEWCGALFERLYAAFHNFWKQRGMKLVEPEFPLVAIILAGEKEFADFATKDAGADAATAKGYYSIQTNRIVLYDLTAADAQPIRNTADIDQQLAAAPYNIATVIHEATHQIAFNSGMHTRLADNPLWLAEGMAMYFETPDLSSKNGWKSAGAVNHERLDQFRDFQSTGRRKPDSLRTLLSSDSRFNDEAQMPDAYAEAWALTFYLIKNKKKEYVKYLGTLAAKPPLVFDTPEERLAEFCAIFGDDLKKIDADFLKSMRSVK